MNTSRIVRAVVATAMVVTASWVAAVGAPATAAAVQKLGNGIGTKAALANANCDPETGLIRIPLVARPPCTRDVPASANGGDTAPGVTRDSIKVVIVVTSDPTKPPTDPGAAATTRNLATGQPGNLADGARDNQAIFQHAFETYGRELDFEFYVSTGIDEAAQRADAVAITAKKPFAVVNALKITGDVLAQNEIITFDVPTDPAVIAAQAPYRWSWSTDYYAISLQAAEVLGKQVWGAQAEFAGEPSMRDQKRKFGIVYPGDADASPYPDIATFEATVKKYGGGAIPVKLDYADATGADAAAIDSQNQQNAVPIINKLKDAGVTTVVTIASQSMLKGLTFAATQQDYHPEWFCAEWFNCSFDYFARQLDQEQWAHAFGVGSLFPGTRESVDLEGSFTKLLEWYWGPQRGTTSGGGLTSQMFNLYQGVHMAGPKLTAATLRAGLFAKPLQGGAADGAVGGLMNGFGPKVGLPYPAFSASGVDGGLWWYDPDVKGFSNIFPLDGTGKVMWMDGGQRYRPGTYPTGPQPLFEPDQAIAFIEPDVDAALVPSYPCEGCPSQGGT